MSVITYEQYAKMRTDEELIIEAKAIYSHIFNLPYYIAKGQPLLTALQKELTNRGFNLKETSELLITK